MSSRNSAVRMKKGIVVHADLIFIYFFLVYYNINLWLNCARLYLFRIVVLKQTRDVLLPLNFTLVDLVMRPILPSSHHPLSAHEVAAAIKKRLQTAEENIWPSWTVRHRL